MKDTYIQSRSTAIESIESTIAELRQIFTQLAQMVAEQRETVQRIDADTVDIASNVSGAQRELLKYYASISSNRWLMLKIFGVLIVFVSQHPSVSSRSVHTDACTVPRVHPRIISHTRSLLFLDPSDSDSSSVPSRCLTLTPRIMDMRHCNSTVWSPYNSTIVFLPSQRQVARYPSQYNRHPLCVTYLVATPSSRTKTNDERSPDRYRVHSSA